MRNLTPAKHVYAQTLTNTPSLQQKITRELAGQIREVENCRQPRILLSYEIRVFDQAKDSLGANSSLVRLLDSIAEPHQWQQIPIYLPKEFLIFSFRVIRFANHIDIAVFIDSNELAFGNIRRI